MKIRAAILNDSGQPGPYAERPALHVRDVDLSAPRRGELLIRIEAAGLCHSDLAVINGDRPRPMPMALGHEAVGTVVQTGDPEEPAFQIGDRVVLSFLPMCGACARCAAGEGYMCAAGAAANGRGELLRGGFRLSERGQPVHHHLGVSAFADHAVVDRRSAVVVPKDVPVEIAALFGCAVLTGVGAVLNSANLRAGESLAVVGLGGVGLAALIGALAGGANPIIGIDPIAEKRQLALDLGAAIVRAPDALDGIDPPDVVIETVGRAQALESAYRLARRGGRIVSVGLPNPAEMFSIPAVSLVADGKTLIGSYLWSSIPARDIPRYLGLWRAGRLPVERLLTGIYPLDEINLLFDRLAAGEVVRQIVRP